MLIGKKYPQNVCALRMLVEELLRPLFQESSFDGMDNLLEELNKRSIASRTTKLWVDVVIKSILNVLLFVRAEREGDWPVSQF